MLRSPSWWEPIRAATLDAEELNLAERRRPGKQLGVAGIGCRELQRVSEAAAQPVDRERDVFVFVSVDTDDDIGAFKREACHDC